MPRIVRSFFQLEVYKRAREVCVLVFELTKIFPREEMYSLTDQVRRSSSSIGAQIAEAWGKRRFERHFISKLTDADAEQLETQHWVSVSLQRGYISFEEKERLKQSLFEVGKMLNSMMQQAASFCPYSSDLKRSNKPIRLKTRSDEILAASPTRPLTTDHRPPTTDHGPPTTDHRPLTTDR